MPIAHFYVLIDLQKHVFFFLMGTDIYMYKMGKILMLMLVNQ